MRVDGDGRRGVARRAPGGVRRRRGSLRPARGEAVRLLGHHRLRPRAARRRKRRGLRAQPLRRQPRPHRPRRRRESRGSRRRVVGRAVFRRGRRQFFRRLRVVVAARAHGAHRARLRRGRRRRARAVRLNAAGHARELRGRLRQAEDGAREAPREREGGEAPRGRKRSGGQRGQRGGRRGAPRRGGGGQGGYRAPVLRRAGGFVFGFGVSGDDPNAPRAVGSGEAPRATPPRGARDDAPGGEAGHRRGAGGDGTEASFPLGACARGEDARRGGRARFTGSAAHVAPAHARRARRGRGCARGPARRRRQQHHERRLVRAGVVSKAVPPAAGLLTGGHLEGAQSRGRGAAGRVRRGARAARALRQAHPRDSGYRKSGRGRGGRRGGRARLGPVVRVERRDASVGGIGRQEQRSRWGLSGSVNEPKRSSQYARRARHAAGEGEGEPSRRALDAGRRRLVARLGELSGR